MKFDFEYFKTAADYINDRTGGFVPKTGLILGSGLSGLAGLMEVVCQIPYQDIPNFLVSTAPGHAGRLIFGYLEGRPLVCMSGRFHSYEGYSYEELVTPVRVLKLLGIEELITTNAAGAINETYRPGEVMLVKDHIKFNGDSPLRGPNIADFGPRFFDVTDMYTKKLRQLAKECAPKAGVTLHEGVYFFMTGPQFETPAEIRACRLLGGDAVGMSNVTEALTAAHMGLPLLAMSLITNMAAGVLDQPLTTEEVNRAGEEAAPRMEAFMRAIIRALEARDNG
ncbi:MAG: purine-nucleoside phosphorylase [Firmicutes bacterium]|nr:purine-nucleoside phosphorylase [Bacillota bacterium]